MSSTNKTFLDQIKPLAFQIETETGIFHLVAIVQAAHESNWGKSGLTVKANNLFGFTGDSWKKQGKPVIELPTQECINGKWITVRRPFRSYDSWLQSLQDWARLMSTLPRYAKAYKFAKEKNSFDFYKAVAEAGYATDPKYAEKLMATELWVKKELS